MTKERSHSTQKYDVAWHITEEAESPRKAAEQIYTSVFERELPAGPDDACVFEVTDPEGDTVLIDLSKDE